MKDSIIEIMTDILKLEKDTLLENFDSQEIWDSLLRVEILFAVEEEFDIQFEEDELVELVTPQKLCEATLRKAAE